MYCRHCGAELPDSAVFCGSCGQATKPTGSETGLGMTAEELPLDNPAHDTGKLAVDDPVQAETAEAKPQATQLNQEAPQSEAAPTAAIPDGNAAGTQPAASPENTGRKRTAAIAVIAVSVLVIVGAVIGILWHFEQERKAAGEEAARIAAQEEWDRQHKTFIARISINAPELDDGSTPVPVRVTGTDFEGNEVSACYGITAHDDSVELVRGTYSATVIGTPINSQGRIYSYEPTGVDFVVDEDGSHPLEGSGASPETGGGEDGAQPGNEQPSDAAPRSGGGAEPVASFSFELVAPEDVTDEQIGAAYDALRQIGYSQEEAQGPCDAVRKSRQERLDQIAAEKAEAERKAAEEAARRANPSRVDGSASPVTLKGTVVREEWPTSKTMMAWSAVAYFLQLDEPVEVTLSNFAEGGKATTRTTDRIHIASVEQVLDNANNFDGQSDPKWEPYVGQFVAINGELIQTGGAHTLAAAMFKSPNLEEVF